MQWIICTWIIAVLGKEARTPRHFIRLESECLAFGCPASPCYSIHLQCVWAMQIWPQHPTPCPHKEKMVCRTCGELSCCREKLTTVKCISSDLRSRTWERRRRYPSTAWDLEITWCERTGSLSNATLKMVLLFKRSFFLLWKQSELIARKCRK